MRDYCIHPIESDGTTTVTSGQVRTVIHLGSSGQSDKWLLVWVGLKPVFLCGKCQERRRQWALNHFQSVRPQIQEPKKPPKREAANPFDFLNAL